MRFRITETIRKLSFDMNIRYSHMLSYIWYAGKIMLVATICFHFLYSDVLYTVYCLHILISKHNKSLAVYCYIWSLNDLCRRMSCKMMTICITLYRTIVCALWSNDFTSSTLTSNFDDQLNISYYITNSNDTNFHNFVFFVAFPKTNLSKYYKSLTRNIHQAL